MNHLKFFSGLQSYLIKDAVFEGKDEIPMMLDLKNTEIPNTLIPFNKAKHSKNKAGYIHFYIDDNEYKDILINTSKYDELFSSFDGIITPDPTITIGCPHCQNAAMTMINRAIGFYEQKRGIPVIPNIRWGDPSTYDFCFLGVPTHSIVSISTHGAISKNKETNNLLRTYFKKGLNEMLLRLKPEAVIVYGRMPNDIFGSFSKATKFICYSSDIENAHKKR